MIFQKETMTQATPIASPVQIVPATDANMYTAAQDNVWEEVLTCLSMSNGGRHKGAYERCS